TRTAVFRSITYLKNCLNPRRSSHNAFTSVSIHGRRRHTGSRKNLSRSDKLCVPGAHRCGLDCVSSMATAQSGRLESRVNSMPQFTAKLTQERETTYSTIRLAKTANWHDLGWMESLWRENWTSLLARLLSVSWLLRLVKDALF